MRSRVITVNIHVSNTNTVIIRKIHFTEIHVHEPLNHSLKLDSKVYNKLD